MTSIDIGLIGRVEVFTIRGVASSSRRFPGSSTLTSQSEGASAPVVRPFR